MDAFLTLFIAAVLSEGIWEILKNLLPQKGEKVWTYLNLAGSLAVGILIAVATNLNLFTLLDVPMRWPTVGVVLTGVFISRGSNYIHDLVKKLKDPE